MLTGHILIQNRSERITEINIEGLIGTPEEGQFENPEAKTATYDKLQRQIESLRGIETPEILVHIRSTGGNLSDALLIHDALCASGKRITTRCYGYTASAATLIVQAASKGRREMSANGLFLIHQSVCTGEGNANQLSQALEMLNQTDRRIAELYAARSGKPAEQFARLMRCNNGNGKWLSPKEAKEAGLIDRIIAPEAIANEASEAVRILNLPELPEASLAENGATAPESLWARLLELAGRLFRIPDERPGIAETGGRLKEPSPGGWPGDPHAGVQPACTGAAEAPRRKPMPEDPPLRLAALATQTLPDEDPSQEENLLSPNALSYQQDLRQFIP